MVCACLWQTGPHKPSKMDGMTDPGPCFAVGAPSLSPSPCAYAEASSASVRLRPPEKALADCVRRRLLRQPKAQETVQAGERLRDHEAKGCQVHPHDEGMGEETGSGSYGLTDLTASPNT